MVTIHINHLHFFGNWENPIGMGVKKKRTKESEKEKDFYSDQTVPSIQFQE